MDTQVAADATRALIMAGIWLAVMIGFFLILREFWCWYWKINELSRKADRIISALEKLDKNDLMLQTQMVASMREQRSMRAAPPSIPEQ